MKITRLKPHVHKIKGAKNYALFDLLKGNFYTIEPEGDVEELKNALKEAGLTFETEGVVPFKTEIDVESNYRSIQLRTLQVRLNGEAEDNCWNRIQTGGRKRNMTSDMLALVKQQLENIAIQTIQVEAETYNPEQMHYVLKEFPYKEVVVFIRDGLKEEEQEDLRRISENRNASIAFTPDGKKNIKERKVRIERFFFNKAYNACLGLQAAIDCGGEIKPCLWWKESIGNVRQNNLRDMINKGTFEEYWRLTKDSIDTCKECEIRYVCNDCRLGCHPDAEMNSTQKPVYCNYNPYTGEYEKE